MGPRDRSGLDGLSAAGDIVTEMNFWDQLRRQGFASRRLDEQLGEAVAVYVAPSPPDDDPEEDLEEETEAEFLLEIAEDDELPGELAEAEATDPGGIVPAALRAAEGEALIIARDPGPGGAAGGFAAAAQDDETVQLPLGPSRFPNSLGLSDSRVIAVLREENYPHLEDVDDETLVTLSRLEEELMARAVALGEAYLRLQELLPSRDLWQAAVWVTGMHRDPMMREGLRRLRQEGSDSAARWLGWMVWPYTEELLGAAAGVDDPAGIAAACEGLADVLRRRAELIRGGPRSLGLEADRYPAEAQGIFRREGFRWLEG